MTTPEEAKAIADNWKQNDLMKAGILKWQEDKKSSDKMVFESYLDCIRDKKWGDASEVLVKWILSKNYIYTTKDDTKTETWIYKDGIYTPQGRSEIKEQLRRLLGKWYSVFVINQVLIKVEADTYIEADRFFNTNHKYEVLVENGILNILTLELQPYTPTKIFFNKLPVKFVPGIYCPKIDKFFKEVLKDEEDVQLIYELLGFCLLKEYKFEKAFMFLGYGRNGKGKTIELLKRILGMENCCSIPLSSITSDNFSVSGLFSKLANLAGDISNKDLKDTGMFKSLTGRDLVGGKRKFLKDLFFENYAKFIFACNELPTVYDMSKGFWDRWILLEFPYTFVTQDEYDKTEDKKLLKIRDDDIISKITTPEELSGLLNQALIGLSNVINNRKFSTTKGSEEVKTTWIRNSNSCMAFCFDMIEDDPDGRISKLEFRRTYALYCKKHKLKNKSDVVVKNVLQEMFGVEDTQNWDTHERFWQGIKWKTKNITGITPFLRP